MRLRSERNLLAWLRNGSDRDDPHNLDAEHRALLKFLRGAA